MTILISDLDGTLTNNKQRTHLENNLYKYFSNIGYDRKNKIGVDLYNSINADLRIIISDRPSYWPSNEEVEHILSTGKEVIKIWYITTVWLNYYQIDYDEIFFSDPKLSYKDVGEEKINQLIKFINSKKDEKIIYLEDDQRIAEKIKNMFSFVDVNLISYSGARRL